MAEEKAFLVPVVIDDTSERAASVPDKFREVQWTQLPAGKTPPAFVDQVSRLLSPGAAHAPSAARSTAAVVSHNATAPRQPAPSLAALRQTQRVLMLIAAVAVLGVGYLTVDKFVLSRRAAAAGQTSVQTAQAVASVQAPLRRSRLPSFRS